jgi:hypothetical protein
MLGDDIAAALPNLRAHAVSRMSETVRLGTLTEDVDEDTLESFNIFDTVYEGVGRLRFPQAPNGEVDVAGQLVVLQGAVLSLPSGTTGITPDMRAVVDASTADVSLVGRVFRIQGFAAAGQTTATRFAVEESGEQIPEES